MIAAARPSLGIGSKDSSQGRFARSESSIPLGFCDAPLWPGGGGNTCACCGAALRSLRPDRRRYSACAREAQKAGLGIVLDMRTQLGDGAEAHGSLRELGLNRSVRIKRVGH